MADTEAGWYRVCLNTIVRAKVELDSERLRILPMGSKVLVEEKRGRRVRISQPLAGWCSISSSNGDTILTRQETQGTSQTPTDAARLQKMKNKFADRQAAGESTQKLDQDIKNLEAQLKSRADTVATLQKSLASSAHEGQKFRPGDVVQVAGKEGLGLGIVRYVGGVKDVEGLIIGIEWDTKLGDQNGKIILPNGEEGGFDAPEGFASFVAVADVRLIEPERLFVQLVLASEQQRLQVQKQTE